MTSSCFVWIWLDTASEPVVCGRLDKQHERWGFTYGRSYLGRPEAVPLYGLPLVSGTQVPTSIATAPAQILDSVPDSWGRQVLSYRAVRTGQKLDGLSDMLLAGSTDRIGALEFHPSSTVRDLRGEPDQISLDDLVAAAAAIDEGVDPGDLAPEIEAAIWHGSSDAVGGARPKVLTSTHLIKLSRSNDPFSIERAEAVAMRLAGEVGIDTPEVELVHFVGREGIRVKRFDRGPSGERRMLVSALSILDLHDETDGMSGRYASYFDLAKHLRLRSRFPAEQLVQLFRRVAFNICVGNTDDHARNHAAIWDGEFLTLTPAYDICPQGRLGGEAMQAMAYGSDGERTSNLNSLVVNASEYGLGTEEAQSIVDQMVAVIERRFRPLAHELAMSDADVKRLEAGAILNDSIFY